MGGQVGLSLDGLDGLRTMIPKLLLRLAIQQEPNTNQDLFCPSPIGYRLSDELTWRMDMVDTVDIVPWDFYSNSISMPFVTEIAGQCSQSIPGGAFPSPHPKCSRSLRGEMGFVPTPGHQNEENATKNASKYAKAIFIYNIANIAIENWVSESMSIHLTWKIGAFLDEESVAVFFKVRPKVFGNDWVAFFGCRFLIATAMVWEPPAFSK